jgi:hypothetical protein
MAGSELGNELKEGDFTIYLYFFLRHLIVVFL